MKLRDYKNGRGCKVATIRSRVTGRTTKVVEHNLQEKTILTRVFGSLKLLASAKDFRTIYKYGSFESYLLNIKANGLSEEALTKKRLLMNYLANELKLENITSLLSNANKSNGVKEKMIDHIDSLYITGSLG